MIRKTGSPAISGESREQLELARLREQKLQAELRAAMSGDTPDKNTRTAEIKAQLNSVAQAISALLVGGGA